MSTIPVYIPYVNRPDLLQKAIASVPRRMTTEPVVINNSGAPLDIRCRVVDPYPNPATFSQTQNWMMRDAQKLRVPFYFFMHSDAEAEGDTIEQLYKMAMHECSRGKWSVVYTNYDALAAFNTEAFDAVGGWDEGFEWYASDSDVYRRLRIAGYPTLESGLPVKHEPSQTLNSDPEIKRKVDAMFGQRVKRYVDKWGGDIGSETFDVPWGGK